MADDKPNTEHGPKEWRGSATSAGRAEAKYAWQSDDREAAPLHIRRATFRRRLRVIGMGLVTMVIAALFLAELLFSQLRTPMIVISPGDYEFPFHPLAWSHEDLEGFSELDRETLSVHGLEAGWKTKDQGLRQLDSHLQNILQQKQLPASIMLYVRMHAAVDGAGVPCLVAPGANPFNAESWIPVKDLLDRFRLQKFPDSISKLVIFDCGSVLSDWNQGVVFNTFATRLSLAVTESAIPNLIAINATGPAELAATSTEMRRGVFAHFLKLGLTGAADLESGNADRTVSVSELHRYLFHNVNAWSLKNRNRPQRPQLISPADQDFAIVTSFNPNAKKYSKAESPSAVKTSAIVSFADMTSLWKKYEDCQKYQPLRFDPVGWTEFEQQLRWLEEAIDSGEAYSRPARRVYQELQLRVANVESTVEEAIPQKAVLARWAAISADPLLRGSSDKLNTVELSTLFGKISPSSVENVNSILSHFTNAPSTSSLTDAIQALTSNADCTSLEITCLLQLWQRYHVMKLWPDPSLFASVVELHRLADSASTPADERTLEWIRDTIEQADTLRRSVDDSIFLGGNSPLQEIAQATEIYQRAKKIADEISRAYEIRDRVDHGLPYLAQWLLRPRIDDQMSTENSTGQRTTLLEQKTQILELMRNQRSLERALSLPAVSDNLASLQLPIQGLVSNIESQYGHLYGILVAEYERLLQSNEAKATTWNSIQDLLSIPLLPPRNEQLALNPSQQRILLLEKRIVIERKLVDEFAESTSVLDRKRKLTAKPLSPSEEIALGSTGSNLRPDVTRMAEYLNETLIEVPETLGLTIIRRDENEVVDDLKLVINPQAARAIHEIETIADMQGRFLRLFVKSAPDAIPVETEEQSLLAEKRAFQNCLAERIVRSTASVSPLRIVDDPIALRRCYELQSMLLWHAKRVSNDFWGRCSPEGPEFFDVTATRLTKMAESLGRMAVSLQTETAGLKSQLNKLKNAAATGLVTVSDNLLITDDAEQTNAKIAVYQQSKQDSMFPNGTAAVYVQSPNGERMGEAYPLTISSEAGSNPAPNATQFNVPLSGISHQADALALKATTSFRGHDFSGDLTVNSVAGIVVDYSPNTQRESRIVIRGRRTRKRSVVFVVDCSNSMGQNLSLANDNRSGSRLEIAKLALESMLDKLAEDDTHRVGVVCFGHRIGWDVKQKGVFLRQTEYGAPIPDQLRPYDDVETILPLGRFNSSFAAAVGERLATIKAWGESPLYLALIQALKMFDNDEQDTDRCVVVITDGMNYQFNAPATSRKSINDVLTTWNDHRVPIHIVGLGIGADQADQAQREFGELARNTEGSYVSAQEARILAESLASIQKVSRFSVRSVTDNLVQTAELGQSVTVESDLLHVKEFDVSLGSAAERVGLFGGEAVEFLTTRDEQRLEVPPYEIGQPQFLPLVRGDKQNSVTDFVAGIHRPFRRGQKVTFEISVQHQRKQFVVRPKEVWLEIVPMARPGQPTPEAYVFYDAHYVPNTTVPLLRWTVSDWPTDAVQAKIRFWCREDESKPTASISMQSVSDAAKNPDFTIETIPGVNSRIRIKKTGIPQISVVERHSAESNGVGSLKVSLKSNGIPSRVRHRFDAANRIDTHFFEFSTDFGSVVDDGEVQLTTRADALQGAWRIRKSRNARQRWVSWWKW